MERFSSIGTCCSQSQTLPPMETRCFKINPRCGNVIARKNNPMPLPDRLRISNTWGKRFADHKLTVPILLRRAGLPVTLFQQEKVCVTTAELFALWRGVSELSADPGIGLKLGAETRLARSHPAGIAVMCSRTFADALQRLSRYKQLTCPEEIRIQ